MQIDLCVDNKEYGTTWTSHFIHPGIAQKDKRSSRPSFKSDVPGVTTNPFFLSCCGQHFVAESFVYEQLCRFIKYWRHPIGSSLAIHYRATSQWRLIAQTYCKERRFNALWLVIWDLDTICNCISDPSWDVTGKDRFFRGASSSTMEK